VISILGLLRHGFGHDVVDLRWEIGATGGHRWRLLVHMCPHERGGLIPGIRNIPSQALIEHTAQRVEISPAIDFFALNLLGRDIVDSADDLAGRGKASTRRDDLGNAESLR
jgi:hypothetical protein